MHVFKETNLSVLVPIKPPAVSNTQLSPCHHTAGPAILESLSLRYTHS